MLFNKKLIIYAISALTLLSMLGCSSISQTSNVSTNVDNKTKETSTISDAHTNASDDSSSSTVTKEKNNDSTSSSTQEQNNFQEMLLENIRDLAKQGKLINCDSPVKINICDVETKWGKPDKSEWISEAKGIYYTYFKYNVVLGCNKGDQIFEARSFDNKLSEISIYDVEEYFGKPEHDVNVNGEEIIGYAIGEDFKIEFVFPKHNNSTKIPILKHYNILYPQGTVNNMAGDPGRKW